MSNTTSFTKKWPSCQWKDRKEVRNDTQIIYLLLSVVKVWNFAGLYKASILYGVLAKTVIFNCLQKAHSLQIHHWDTFVRRPIGKYSTISPHGNSRFMFLQISLYPKCTCVFYVLACCLARPHTALSPRTQRLTHTDSVGMSPLGCRSKEWTKHTSVGQRMWGK